MHSHLSWSPSLALWLPAASTSCNTRLKINDHCKHDRKVFTNDSNVICIGILAAIWPCGMVVHLSELFVSESKSQVYAAIHEFLHNHANVFEGLSEYLMSVSVFYYS